MLRTLAILALVATALPAAAANIIVNPAFDTEVPSNGTGGGWTSDNIDGLGGWFAGLGNPGPAFRLNTGPGGESTISQVVSGLMIGQQYVITGEYALGFGGGNPANSFEVRVDSGTILSLGPDPTHDPNGGVFTPFAQFQVAFDATATSHEILFAGQANGSDHDYVIDNICMDVVACTVPEPGAPVFLVAGLSILVIRLRRSLPA